MKVFVSALSLLVAGAAADMVWPEQYTAKYVSTASYSNGVTSHTDYYDELGTRSRADARTNDGSWTYLQLEWQDPNHETKYQMHSESPDCFIGDQVHQPSVWDDAKPVGSSEVIKGRECNEYYTKKLYGSEEEAVAALANFGVNAELTGVEVEKDHYIEYQMWWSENDNEPCRHVITSPYGYKFNYDYTSFVPAIEDESVFVVPAACAGAGVAQ
eukprot:Rmarinus@m.19036